jgi:hypothetical protein
MLPVSVKSNSQDQEQKYSTQSEHNFNLKKNLSQHKLPWYPVTTKIITTWKKCFLYINNMIQDKT